MELKRYNLSGNPFAKHIMSPKRTETTSWKSLLKRLDFALHHEGCRFLIILGDYGLGKTFNLLNLYRDIKKGKIEGTQKSLAIDMKHAVTGLPVKSSTYMKTYFGVELLYKLFDNIGFDKIHEIAKKIDFSDTNPDVNSINRDIRSIFTQIKKGSQGAFDVLTGRAKTKADLSLYGIKLGLTDNESALEYYFAFLRFMKLASFETLIILWDEFEYILQTQSSTNITRVLNTLKEIYDYYSLVEHANYGSLANTIFIISMTPGGWNALSNIKSTSIKKSGGGGIVPFMDRISRADLIELSVFSYEDTLDLIKNRLQNSHINKKLENNHFPFTKEAIKLLHDEGERVPRKILELCEIVLADAYKKGLNKITESETRNILESYGIISV